MRKWLVIFIPILIVLVIGLGFVLKKSNHQIKYTFTKVERGDLENTVSATGTLEPVTTIEVGTQVSGIIDHIYADFNERVKKGQLLAVVDTTLLILKVRDAEAALIQAKAKYEQSVYDFNSTKKMFEQNLLSELEYITSKTNFETAKASLQSARNSLERAERDMRYAFITSPISGTVIDRAIEEGQTVAASFQTPTLFLIAEDLSKMEIHAQVDESDIGLIKKGQSVRFEVQAYDDIFTGTVREVRLEPQVVQNVVNYTVVIDADNKDDLLLPGMTATIDFIVEQKKNVLLVPASALKIQPTEEMAAAMKENMHQRFEGRPDSLRSRFQGAKELSGSKGNEKENSAPVRSLSFTQNGQNTHSAPSLIWYLDEKKRIQAQPVRTGLTDGKKTEVIPLRGSIHAGMEIIASVEGKAISEKNNHSGGMFMGPGFGGPPPR